MKSRYKIGLIYLDGYKCWAKHHPLNTIERARATARMCWLAGITPAVKETVIFDTKKNEIHERYNGRDKKSQG